MRIKNKKAFFNYKLEPERIEAGISLIGGEVKAVRDGNVDLKTSYARIIGNEAYLVNTHIAVPGKKDYDPTRSRKLLLKRDEIISIQTKMKQKRLTLVPVAVYTKSRFIKVELALGKSKKKFEKKETLKARDLEREVQKALKG